MSRGYLKDIAVCFISIFALTLGGCSGTLFETITSDTEAAEEAASGETTPPTLDSVTTVDNVTIVLTFSEALDQTTADDTANYTIDLDTATVPVTISSVALDSSNTTDVTVTLDGSYGYPGMGSGTYTMTVTGVKDASSNKNTISNNGSDNVQTFDGDALPSLSGAIAIDKTHIQLTFSEDVDQTSAENIINYLITISGTGNSLTISSAAQDSVDKTVIVLTHTPEQTPGTNNYKITADGVTDTNSNPLDATANYAEFGGIGDEDTTEPRIFSSESESNTETIITFSEEMKADSFATCTDRALQCSSIAECATLLTVTASSIDTSTEECVGGTTLDVSNAEVITNTAKVRLTTDTQIDTVYCVTVNTDAEEACDTTHAAGDTNNNPLSNDANCDGAGTRKCNLISFTGDALPIVESASAVDSTQIEVVFSEAVMSDSDASAAECDLDNSDCSAEKALNYDISTGTLDVFSATIKGSTDPENRTVILSTSPQTEVSYTLTVANGSNSINSTYGVKDLTGNYIEDTVSSYSVDFTGVETADSTSPFVVSVSAAGNSSVLVTFSEAIEEITAETIENYSISSSLAVTDACWIGNADCRGSRPESYAQVLLTTDPQSSTTYTLTVTGVEDESSNLIGTPNTGSFEGDALPTVLAATSRGCLSTRVVFSKDMDETTCETAGNYTLSVGTPSATVSSAERNDINKNIVDITSSELGLDETYTLTVDTVEDLNGNVITSSNTADFTVIPTESNEPYVLIASSSDKDTIRVTFSENMQNSDGDGDCNGASPTGACLESNYTISLDSGTCTGWGSASVTEVTKVNEYTFDLTADVEQCSFDIFKVEVSNLSDTACNSITDPTFATFEGTGPTDESKPKILFATSIDEYTVEVTFSEEVSTNAGVFGNWVSPIAGCTDLTITAAVQQSDPAKVRLTHTPEQLGCNYLVSATSSITDIIGNVVDPTADTGSFTGSGDSILTPGDGQQFSDPFGDGTVFGFSFVYRNRVYIGPNDHNSGAVRFEANGANLINVSFDAGSGYDDGGSLCEDKVWYDDDGDNIGSDECQRYDFGHAVNDIDGGPDDMDGVGSFTSGSLSGEEYLFAATIQSNATINEIFLTKDADSVLNFDPCTVSAPSGIHASTAVYSTGSTIFVGFASNASAQRPNLNRIGHNGTSCTGNVWAASFAKELEGVGANQGNPRSGSTVVIGIDQIVSFTRDTSDYLVVVNNGGFSVAVLTDTLPATNTEFKDVHPTDWDRTSPSLVSTRVYSSLDTLQPWEKSFPAVVDFGTDTLFVARNKCNLTADDDDVDCEADAAGYVTPELWKGECSDDCTETANWTWTKVFDAADFTTGNLFDSSFGPEIDAIGLVIVNGDRLYVGLDSETDGAHLVYTTNTSPTSVSDFTEIGRAAESGTCDYIDSGKAFGGDCDSQRFFSGASITYGLNYYFYMSLGNNTIPLQVFRQID